MGRNLKILIAAILIAGVFTQDMICKHLGFGQTKYQKVSTSAEQGKEMTSQDSALEMDTFIDEDIYRWDEQLMDWIIVDETQDFKAQVVSITDSQNPISGPVEVDWKVLMDIQYKLQYFKELDMEIYAPVFSEAVKALHGKEIVIEGYVIPIDEEEDLLSLSFNPYASCFFCGKGSPASVMSMYLKEKSKRYKIDDFKKFRGTLYLNHDDPNEFYYILRDAKEVKG